MDVIRKIVKPRMSTYSFEVDAVAIVDGDRDQAGDRLAAGVRARRPQRQRVDARPERPAVDRHVTVWLSPLLRVIARRADAETAPMPDRAGRRSTSAPPSTVSVTVPAEVRPVRCSGVLTLTVVVPVPPVDGDEHGGPTASSRSRG